MVCARRRRDPKHLEAPPAARGEPMTGPWPRVTGDLDLTALKAGPGALTEGVAALARRHGWSGLALAPFATGSLPVFALGDEVVLKLYPPPYRDDFTCESRVLTHLGGRVACPSVLAAGEHEGWCYLAMTRLEGRPLAALWSEL